MLVRHFKEQDEKRVKQLISSLELDYAKRDLSCFLVGLLGEEIIGIAELKEFKDYFLLSCLGIDSSKQGHGHGRQFVNKVCHGLSKPIYLYTVIPRFFAKVGFDQVVAPQHIVSRDYYNCQDCQPSSCRCMVKNVS